MEAFVVYLIIAIISIALSYMASKTQISTEKPNLTIDDDSFPMATEDKNWNLIYGTVLVEGLNCTWYGDYNSFEIIERVKQKGMFGSKTIKNVAAYGHRAGFKLCIGYGNINLRELRFEDKPFYTTKTNGDLNITINRSQTKIVTTPIGSIRVVVVNNNEFFGDYRREGGIDGTIFFNSGTLTQTVPSYIKRFIGDDKAYVNKYQSFILFKNFYYGNHKQLKKVSAVVNRIPANQYMDSRYSELPDGSCNPVDIIFDLLTNPIISDVFSGDIQTSGNIDIANFKIVQKQLFDEGFGLSTCINKDKTIMGIVSDILAEIEGHLYQDAETGMLRIKISRQNYDYEDLLNIDDSMILSVDNISTNSTTSSINQMKMTYLSAEDGYDKRVIVFNNEASYYEVRNTTQKSIAKLNVNSFELAKKLLIREIKPLTQRFIRADITVNRSARHIRAGDVVVVNSPTNKLNNIAMRVLTIDLGSSDSSKIKMNLMQDLFGEMRYNVSEKQDKIQPVETFPENVNLQIIDAPYFLSEVPDEMNKTNQDLITFAARPNESNIHYSLFDDSNLELSTVNSPFCSTSGVLNPITRHSTTIALKDLDLSRGFTEEFDSQLKLGANLAVIIEGAKQEFISYIKYNDVTSSIVNVNRGLLDSIPSNFTTNAQIYFIDDAYSIIDIKNYLISENAKVKAQSKTLKYSLPLDQATTKTKVVNRRAYLPINLSNLKINNVKFNDSVDLGSTNSLVFTYSHRHKVKDYVQYYDELNEINKENTSYRFKIKGNLKPLVTIDSTSNTLTYDIPEDDLSTVYTIEISAFNGTFESLNKYSFTINRTPIII